MKQSTEKELKREIAYCQKVLLETLFKEVQELQATTQQKLETISDETSLLQGKRDLYKKARNDELMRLLGQAGGLGTVSSLLLSKMDRI